MSRLMSFALTEPQLLNGMKTVTRRVGWLTLKEGDELVAVRKAMGLKKGESVKRLARLRVMSVRREPLNTITQADCRAEGFPGHTPESFVAFFCRTHPGCTPRTEITRIEFEMVERL